MINKPKRKNSFRRWLVLRGLILTLTLFIASVGYLLTHLPEYEEVVYLNNGNVYRIRLAPNAQPELLVDSDDDIIYTGYSEPINSVVLLSQDASYFLELATLQFEEIKPRYTFYADPRIQQYSGVTSDNKSYLLTGGDGYGRRSSANGCRSANLEMRHDSQTTIDSDFNMQICLLPLWHPDGVRVVLMQKVEDEAVRLILYNVETEEIEVLMEDRTHLVNHISNLDDWNSDGTAFMFTIGDESSSQIWLYDVNQEKAYYITDGYLPLFAD